jgi:hypothetical protein
MVTGFGERLEQRRRAILHALRLEPKWRVLVRSIKCADALPAFRGDPFRRCSIDASGNRLLDRGRGNSQDVRHILGDITLPPRAVEAMSDEDRDERGDPRDANERREAQSPPFLHTSWMT